MTHTWPHLALVSFGVLLLVAALFPARGILQHSPRHTTGWKVLLGLIIFFIGGYVAFGYFLYNSPGGLAELIVTLIFVGGAAFVLLVMSMSHRTVQHAGDVAQRESFRALHDDLTGLPNRILLRERMTYSLAMAKRQPGPFAVMLMDLDRFKEVNDTLGHAYGDELLRKVGARLRTIIRESDTVARLGGDEFAMLLPGTDLNQAAVVAGKLSVALEQPFEVQGYTLSVGISIGICVYPQHGDTAEALLQHADIAMYNAKRKDVVDISYAFYDIEQDKNTLENLALMGELRGAIRSNQMTVHYQPKIGVHDSRLCGVEALVRWQHPKLGIIPPDKFIPLAEQSGQINALTRWVLNAAFQQYSKWRMSGLHLPISVNISCKDLRDPNFPEQVLELINHWKVPVNDVTLEFTESSMMGEPERTIDIISRLHSIGVKLSIDDFGTGYSSLSYLKRLPNPELKIDRSFVKNMDGDESDAVLVRSTIDLAHNMGLKVTAEGVETKDVLDLLAILGCDTAQGYHMARPMPAEQLEAWMQTRIAA